MSDSARTVLLSDTDFGPEEERAVVDVLRSGWLSSGEQVQLFEREFAEWTGAPHAVAVTNGTAALHLACVALGLGPGDEVLVPALTFVATANAVRYTGATPVFVDIESLDDWTMAVRGVRSRLTARTRAIVAMHYGGFPCDMTALGQIAAEHRLGVIEDAAHTPGTWVGETHAGLLGDAGCFSFFANKNMTSGEGGAVITRDAATAQRLRTLRSHAMSSMSWDRHRGHAYGYEVAELGYNYRFDELRAALARVQLRRLAGNNQRRAERYDAYRRLLVGASGVSVPFTSRRGRFSFHLFPILLDDGIDRLALMKRLRERGVHTSVHYPPVHLFAAYAGGGGEPLVTTEAVGRRALTLPLHPRMSLDDVDFVVRQLKACL